MLPILSLVLSLAFLTVSSSSPSSSSASLDEPPFDFAFSSPVESSESALFDVESASADDPSSTSSLDFFALLFSLPSFSAPDEKKVSILTMFLRKPHLFSAAVPVLVF